MVCSAPVSSVHGIFQTRIFAFIAVSFSKGSSWSRDGTCDSCIVRQFLYHWATRGSPSISWLLYTKLFWTSMDQYVFEILISIFLDICPKAALLDHILFYFCFDQFLINSIFVLSFLRKLYTVYHNGCTISTNSIHAFQFLYILTNTF